MAGCPRARRACSPGPGPGTDRPCRAGSGGAPGRSPAHRRPRSARRAALTSSRPCPSATAARHCRESAFSSGSVSPPAASTARSTSLTAHSSGNSGAKSARSARHQHARAERNQYHPLIPTPRTRRGTNPGHVRQASRWLRGAERAGGAEPASRREAILGRAVCSFIRSTCALSVPGTTCRPAR